MRVWDEVLTDDDKAVIELGKYGQPRGMGLRPALLVIDAQHNYVGEDRPILESMQLWPSSCGERAWRAIEKANTVVRAAREKGVPVIYSRQVQKQSTRFDGFQSKVRRNTENYLDGNLGTDIVAEAGVQEGDIVLDKSYASLFFGTPLISYLIKLKIDTLLITGGSTSGCVRATAVDGVTRNFNVALIEDAVFDRIEASHKASLLDFWMKYGDLMSSGDAVKYLNDLMEVQA